MNIGVRAKLFLLTLVTIACVGLVTGLILEDRLRNQLEHRIENELRHAAMMGCDLLEVQHQSGLDQMKVIADRLSSSSDARVTIIAEDGRVLGDSELTTAETRVVENHGTRPEVASARADGLGLSRRYSTTIETSMLYVAAACRVDSGREGAVRVAMPLDDVDESVRSLRTLLATVGIIGLTIAVLAGWLLLNFTLRRFRRLVTDAKEITAGQGRRLPVETGDEIGWLAGSFSRLAEELDVTVRRLASERDQLETILESMRDAVISLDDNGRIALFNAAALELLDVEGEPLGMLLEEVVNMPEVNDLVEQISETEEGAEVELALNGPPNRTILVRATPLRSATGVVVVMVDVTEMRRLETVRQDFVANVSHELRTPVSVVRANAETLLDGALEDPKQSKRFVEAILRNAERLSNIIADLLDLSRIEADKLTLEVGPVQVDIAVDRAFELLDKSAQSKAITLIDCVTDGLSVIADQTAFDHVLLDLLENAVKYTPRGGRVEVSSEHVGDFVIVEVKDNGPGIKAKHRARIFERFYRVDPGRSRELGGTGLGLSIAKHLIEAMGGEIEMRPAKPQGSIFRITVPADQ